MMRYKLVDLFAGCGGMSLGFQSAGFKIACAYENWQTAISNYSENFPSHPVVNMDLSNVVEAVHAISQHHPDIIIGGPPCQDFSSAGKRNENLGRANLTVSFAQIVAQVRPNIFVMENVDRAAKSKTFQEALAIIKQAGYGVTIKILNAAYCGVPQLRKRLIVIGKLAENDGFMDYLLDEHLSDKPMTVREYFNGSLSFEHYYRHPRSYARRAVFSADEPSPTIRGVNRPIPKGYKGHDGDTIQINSALRSLTSAERAKIQTFPDAYRWLGSKTEIEQLIGNAVPVKLAEYVANQLIQYLTESSNRSPSSYQLFQDRTAYGLELLAKAAK